jgi:hypothetical protein
MTTRSGRFPCLVCPGVEVRATNDTGDGRVRPDWPVHRLWASAVSGRPRRVGALHAMGG